MALTREQLGGVITPMITPLKPNGDIDTGALQRVADYLLEGGVDGLFILGSTGEGPSFSEDKTETIIKKTVRHVGDRAPVLAGVSDTSWERTLSKANLAEALGADAVVSAIPSYYSIYRDAEILRFYKNLSQETSLPIIIYDIPSATKIQLKKRLVLELGSVPNVLGIKDSSEDWGNFQSLLLEREDPSFKIMQGKESFAGASLLFGADGIVPGISNVHPMLAVEIYEAGIRRDIDTVIDLQTKVNKLCQIFSNRPWLPAVKTAMCHLGFGGERAAEPFRELSREDADDVKRILKEYRTKFDEIDAQKNRKS